MMHKFRIYLAAALLGLAATACNDDSDNNTEISIDYASTMVKSFSLKSDSKVLNNLDSIYFSIDLVNARIFNADSLPYGTKINRILVEITTDACSTVEIHFPREGKTDSIVDYLTNPNDSIDFSRGPVKLHLVSFDKVGSRDYKIYLNVHKTIADSLYWNVNTPVRIPSALTDIKAQRTVQFNDKFYAFTTDGTSNASLNITSTPADKGTTTSFTYPFTPDVNSITATSTSIFILDTDGKLYSSPDGTTWNSCGTTWKSITAPYGNTLLGISEINGRLCHVTYPAGVSSTVSSDFPVSGNSQAIRYATDWGLQAQIITAGGLKSDGKPAPSVWAYDGNNWACLAKSTPMEAEGLTMFPYYCCETDTNTWVASTRSVFVAMGGRGPEAKMQGDVYISYDLGFNWTKAPSTMQLPKLFPALHGAQAFVVSEEKHSRATKPITEWDTPYIYLYGGRTQTDAVSPLIYRGVVNRLQFKPLQ